jgi:flagellar biosynthetic protein FliR
LPTELSISASTLLGFLFVLTRVGGAFVFVPLPAMAAAPGLARIVLALGCTVALQSRWPQIDAGLAMPGTLVLWLLAELALGVTIGLAVSMIVEAFVLGAQVLSVQAGFGFASTIDPTQADSNLLQSFAQLAAALLFFAFGLDRQLIAIFASTLDSIPPGSFQIKVRMAEQLIQLGSSIFSIGLRIAFPLMGLLLMVDITIALLGRINQQMQIFSLTFPIKMLLGMAIFGWLLLLFPRLYTSQAERTFALIRAMLRLP